MGKTTVLLHFFFLFQFCSLVFVKPFSSLENTTASHLVSYFFPLFHLATAFSCVFNGTKINMAVFI